MTMCNKMIYSTANDAKKNYLNSHYYLLIIIYRLDLCLRHLKNRINCTHKHMLHKKFEPEDNNTSLLKCLLKIKLNFTF